MTLQIERARAEHAITLTEIAIAAKRHWKYPERWVELWTPSLTISPDYILQNETWMAVVDAAPAGFYSLHNDKYSLGLDNLWVLPDSMGQGIGKQLFLHALERSKIIGASTLKVEADPNAQSFYEKMGARKVGEHHSEVDGQPRILPIMEINL